MNERFTKATCPKCTTEFRVEGKPKAGDRHVCPTCDHEFATVKAGIVIDRWKLPIFTRRLKEAGFSYEEVGPLTDDTLTLIVQTESAQALAQTVLAAQKEAAQSRKPK